MHNLHKIKILICQEHMYVGGTETALINLLNKLDPQLYDIDLLLLDRKGVFYERVPAYVNILYSKETEQLGYSTKKAIMSELGKIRLLSAAKILCSRIKQRNNPHIYDFCLNRLKKVNYDIAINYSTMSNAFTFYLDKCVEAKKKILFLHFEPIYKNPQPGQFSIKGMEKIFKHYTNIIGVSENVTRKFIEILPQCSDKCTTVYNFMDEYSVMMRANEDIDEMKESGVIKILSVGRFTAQKNFTVIPSVCEELTKRNIDYKWYIVGDGDEKEIAQKVIDENGLNDRLILLGAKINPYPYFKACDIYCQPSLSEAYCTTINEARILGKPIVATDFPGIREQLSEGQGGIIADSNAVALADGIEKIVSMSDKEREKMLATAAYPNSLEQAAQNRLFEIIGQK